MLGFVLLSLFLGLFALSLLNIVKAPSNLLWKLSVLSTEWGYILVVPTIGIGYLLYVHFDAAFFLPTAFGICIFFLIPAYQAIQLSSHLHKELADQFGQVHMKEFTFSWRRLFLFYSFKKIKVETAVYKNTEDFSLSLDIYRTESGPKKQACVLVIHGGGWDSGDRTQLSPLNIHLAKQGYTVAAIQYRLAPAYIFPAPVDDVYSAVDFLIAHAEQYGIDAEQFFFLGRSAGGQIAQIAACKSYRPYIKGVIAFYSPADLVWGYTIPTSKWIMDSNKVLGTYLGGRYEDVQQQYEDATVSNFVKPGLPPMLMLHGSADVLVAYEHNIRLMPFLKNAKIPHALVGLPWAVHGFDFNFNGFGGQISTYAIEYFLKAYCRNQDV